MSALTVAVGTGSPVVVLELFNSDEGELVIDFVRRLFETEAARAEGWSTLDDPAGFRAVCGGKAVTFTVRAR